MNPTGIPRGWESVGESRHTEPLVRGTDIAKGVIGVVTVSQVLGMPGIASAEPRPSQALSARHTIEAHPYDMPQTIEHVVLPGETLNEIAELYGVDANSLGYMGDPLQLPAGRVLSFDVEGGYMLPADGRTVDEVAEQLGIPSERIFAAYADESLESALLVVPANVTMHEVKPGETLESLAATYKVDPEEIARANLLAGGQVRAGDHLAIVEPAIFYDEQAAEQKPAPELASDTTELPMRHVQIPAGFTVAEIAQTMIELFPEAAAEHGSDFKQLAQEMLEESGITDPTKIAAQQQIAVGVVLNEAQVAELQAAIDEAAAPNKSEVAAPVTPAHAESYAQAPVSAEAAAETDELYPVYPLASFSQEYQQLVQDIPSIDYAIENYHTRNQGPELPASDIVKLLVNAGFGFDNEDLVAMTAFSLCAESCAAPFVTNTLASSKFGEGTVAVGIWQILGNTQGNGPDWLNIDMRDPQANLNPQVNAHSAFAIYAETGNELWPWEAFGLGMHLDKMDDARALVDQAQADLNNPPAPAAETEVGEIAKYNLDHPLINHDSLRPEDGRTVDGMVEQVDIVDVDGKPVSAEVAYDVARMLQDAREAGFDLSIGSAWRDYASQEQARKDNDCPADPNAPASTCVTPTAPVGRSWHHNGKALDMRYNGQLITSRQSGGFQWLLAHAAGYGFINLPSEPWHWSTNGS